MLTPEEAFDIMLDQRLLHEFTEERDITVKEAHRLLREIAQPILDGTSTPPASPLLRAARVAGSRGRVDVEQLVAFVEHASRLPDRVMEVFRFCVVEGLSLSQCADRLGISRNTVREHLRRLRVLMRSHRYTCAEEVSHGSPRTHD